MSKAVSLNYVDTAISGVTTLPLNRGLVNFGADWKVKVQEPNEVITTNLTSPLGFPEKFRFGISEVSDVYKGVGIDPGLYAPSRKGVSILCQLTDVWTVTETTDAAYQVALPLSAHLVIKVPNNENITPSMIQAFVARMLSGLYETGSTETKRLAAMLRGSLTPSDL